LAACYSASIRGFIATGRRAGRPTMYMGVAVADHADGRSRGPAHGFNLFAGRGIGAFDRQKREHVIRYMARPPLPNGRLELTASGGVRLELKRAWSNGTTHIELEGTEFIERLVSLVPRPRVNIVRYHGAFAPNSRVRAQVIRRADVVDAAEPEQRPCRCHDWATLMSRVFEIDVTQCPRCGTRGMQALACTTQSEVIHKILAHIGEATAPPQLEPPRYAEVDPDCETAA